MKIVNYGQETFEVCQGLYFGKVIIFQTRN